MIPPRYPSTSMSLKAISSLLLLLPLVSSLSPSSCTKTKNSISLQQPTLSVNSRNPSRRDALLDFVWKPSMIMVTATVVLNPTIAMATEDDESTTATTAAPSNVVMSASELLDQLKVVPTFCIVNSETGAAYMLYRKGDGAMAKGYAFLTYPGALAVLADAQKTAEKGGYSATWEKATITVVPANIAMKLALSPVKRNSQKPEITDVNSILEIIPGLDEREAALKLDGQYKKQDKVPLFYSDAVKNPKTVATLVYFAANDLLNDSTRKNGKDVVPPRIKVLELNILFLYAIRNRLAELPVTNIEFVPHPEDMDVAREMNSRGLATYKISKMIV